MTFSDASIGTRMSRPAPSLASILGSNKSKFRHDRWEAHDMSPAAGVSSLEHLFFLSHSHGETPPPPPIHYKYSTFYRTNPRCIPILTATTTVTTTATNHLSNTYSKKKNRPTMMPSLVVLAASMLLMMIPMTAQAVPIHLHGLNYNTRKGPDWDWDKCKTHTEILMDLTLLSRLTNRIRLLSLTDCGQGEMVLSVVEELGMQMWLGMWVGREDYVFEEEKGALVGMLNRGLIHQDTVLGISVGSEAIYRNDSTVDQMIQHMDEVYGLIKDAGLDFPVTIVDIAPIYANSAKLRAAVNVTMTNTFPFWEATPIDDAVADLQADLGYLLEREESKSKPFVLGETGWPAGGFIEGVGVASAANQRQYFHEAFCRIDVENQWSYYWFTGIENTWRLEQDPNNSVEGTFGFLYANLTLKEHFQGLEFTCSDGVTYSFDEIDWTIPDYTPPPSVLDPESCQAHSGCTGLFGNCCPNSNGNFLGCCGSTVPSPKPPSVAPVIPTAVPSTPPPTTVAPQSQPSGSGGSPPSNNSIVSQTAAPAVNPTGSPVTSPPTAALSALEESTSTSTSSTEESSTNTTTTNSTAPEPEPPSFQPTSGLPQNTSLTPTSTSMPSVLSPTRKPTVEGNLSSPTPKPTIEILLSPTPKPSIQIEYRPSPTDKEANGALVPSNSSHSLYSFAGMWLLWLLLTVLSTGSLILL